MRKTQALHSKAMELAEEAALEQATGNLDRARELYRAAFDHERQAAELVEPSFHLEPTRSVLFRSAASLALDCQDHRSAEKLIARGLAGDPPAEIADELRDLLEQAHFQRHLDLRGVVLAPCEFQMSIAGDAVGFGLADSEVFVGRVQDIEKLIYRTAERQSRRPFRERGRRAKGLSKEVGVYLSLPRAASFAVTFRVGHAKQMSLPGMDLAESVIGDMLECIELFDSRHHQEIESRIPDPAYRRNFLALAGRIAPDGEAVRTVGFTAGIGGAERRVCLTRPQSEIGQPKLAEEAAEREERVTIRGTLKFADSTKGDRNEIRVVDAESTKHRIIVPEGMMDDIVRPLWDFEVEAVGTRRGKLISLLGITKASENDDTP